MMSKLANRFDHAYAVTLAHEGGYANHKADRGGETYKGIARKFHPDWPGWLQIDAHLATGASRHGLDLLPGLSGLVMAFYRKEFWQPLRCEEIADQKVAEELFDTSVNMGHKRGVQFLQRSVNLLGRIGNEVVEDGIIGPVTIAAVNALIIEQAAPSIVKAQNGLQFGHYEKIIERDPSQRVFFRGWLRRV
jgi:lysozyme family protein